MKDRYSINRRVMEIYDELKEKQIVNNSGDFAAKVGFQAASFSNIKNDKRTVPMSLIIGLNKAFNVNMDYILSGKGPKFDQEPSTDSKIKTTDKQDVNIEDQKRGALIFENEIKNLILENETLKKLVKTLEERVLDLKLHNEDLRMMLNNHNANVKLSPKHETGK
jgi:hypothetical protein